MKISSHRMTRGLMEGFFLRFQRSIPVPKRKRHAVGQSMMSVRRATIQWQHFTHIAKTFVNSAIHAIELTADFI